MSFWNLSTPPNQPADTDVDAGDLPMDGGLSDEEMDDMVDGDRQLTTDSDALDGGLNDSDLGSPREAGLSADNGTGLSETR